jgi:membrane protein
LRGQTIGDLLRWFWENIWQIATRSDHDHIFLFAAGIAFNIAIAMVPTILILLFALGYILEPDQVALQLKTYLDEFIFSSGSQAEIIELVRAQISAIVENRGIAGILGFFGLIWTASALASSIRVSINNILRCREAKFFLIYKLYDILTIALIGLLVFISIIIGPLLQLLAGLNERLSAEIPLLNVDWIVSESISFGVALILFFVIFRFTPYQRQRYTIVLTGTIVSALLWMIARFIFSMYVAEFRTFSRIYGAYAFLAASAFWIYYAALVFLVGAEVAYQVKQSTWNARRTFHRVAKKVPGRRWLWRWTRDGD